MSILSQSILIKTIQNLTDQELEEINLASQREFKVHLPPRERLNGRYFFLLKDNGRVLAMGELLPVEPIIFNSESFYILGIGGIIANEKGKGYGKQMMMAIKDKLVSLNKTGVGFCKLKNQVFYEKCGFKTDTSALNRFIYQDKEKEFPATLENECILYLDGNDHFMESVLSNPIPTVKLPIPPIW